MGAGPRGGGGRRLVVTTAHTAFTENDVTIGDGETVGTPTVSPSGGVYYRGLERSPSAVEIDVEVNRSDDETWETLRSKSLAASRPPGRVGYRFDPIDVLARSSLRRSDLRSSDGRAAATDLDVRVTATLADAGPGGDGLTAAARQTFAVAVPNVLAGGSVDGQTLGGADSR